MSGFALSFAGDIAHIRLNRASKRNALSADFWAELPKTVRTIDDEAKARVIVISAEGPVFCAGIDTAMLAEMATDSIDKTHPVYGAKFLSMLEHLQNTFTALADCRLPVIAAIQGGCLGAGVDMVTACDLRYCTQDAYFTIAEINIGMVADVGTFPRLCYLLPEAIVRELAYTGRKMSADEAAHYGFVNKVFEDNDALISGVMDIANTISAKPPLAIYGSKRAIDYARHHSTEDALKQIALWNAGFLSAAEIMESLQARAQNRTPNYEDLPKRSK